MTERLDNYEMLPDGMREYLSAHGHHFSKPMYEWAVSMMEGRDGSKIAPMSRDDIRSALDAAGVTIENDKGYDVPYVYMMAKSDYYGSSIVDTPHLALYVKDYIDDRDGAKTRAFDEFYAKTIALGIPIIWPDVI